jgi:hypothetical protein
MLLPALPTPHLVIPQPHGLFASLQGPFTPVALPLHARQPGGRCVHRGGAEASLALGGGVHCPADDHLPRPRLGVVAIPQPPPALQDIHLQRACGAVA